MTFTGMRADINAALDDLALAAGGRLSTAWRRVQITTGDRASLAAAARSRDTDSVTVTVTAVNDEQVLATIGWRQRR